MTGEKRGRLLAGRRPNAVLGLPGSGAQLFPGHGQGDHQGRERLLAFILGAAWATELAHELLDLSRPGQDVAGKKGNGHILSVPRLHEVDRRLDVLSHMAIRVDDRAIHEALKDAARTGEVDLSQGSARPHSLHQVLGQRAALDAERGALVSDQEVEVLGLLGDGSLLEVASREDDDGNVLGGA
jgi:hypothetical protein